MRVGIYARVSTADKDQNPATQLLPLREFAHAQGWAIAVELIDTASATDLRRRNGVAGAPHPGVSAEARPDPRLEARPRLPVSRSRERDPGTAPACRGRAPVAHGTLGRYHVPQGELVFNLLATFVQFERSLIAERVKAGMDRARRQGKHVGRPLALNGDLEALRPANAAGTLSRRQAAKRLGVTVSTVSRSLARRMA